MLGIKRMGFLLLVSALVLILSVPTLGAPATIKKSVQALEGGNFLIKLVVTSSKAGIFSRPRPPTPTTTTPRTSLGDAARRKAGTAITPALAMMDFWRN